MPTTGKEPGPSRSDGAARVLTILPDFPFPATTGLHLRMVSNLELVRRLGCFNAVLYFSTEGRKPAPVDATPLARICDEVRHGGRRFPHAKERDGWRCQVCGSMQNLQVHHLKFRSQSGGDVEQNLITLCAECHEQVHRKAKQRRNGLPGRAPSRDRAVKC